MSPVTAFPNNRIWISTAISRPASSPHWRIWFRSDGEVVHYAAGDRPRETGMPQSPLRSGRTGRFPLCAPRPFGRASRGGVCLCRRVRRRLRRDVRRSAVAGEHRSDVRLHGVACGRRSARSFLSGRSGVRTAGAPAGRTSDLRTLRTDVAALCLYTQEPTRRCCGVVRSC